MKMGVQKKLLSLVVMICMSGVFTGCQQVPQEELDNAKKAVDDAKLAGAAIYAPEQFASVQALYDSLDIEVAGQGRKLQIQRNYEVLKKLIVRSIKASEEIKTAALNNKEKMRATVDESVAQAKTSLQEVKNLVESARKDGKDVSGIQTSLDKADTLFASAVSKVAQEVFPAAVEDADNVTKMTASIKDEINKLPAVAKAKAAPKRVARRAQPEKATTPVQKPPAKKM